MEYRRGAHTVFEIHLHLVWITKYRRPALTGEIATRVRDLIRDICGQHEVSIMKGHVSKDHVHLLISPPPQVTISRLMQWLKGRTAHHLLAEFPHLKRQFWGRHLWARGYFCCSSWNVTDDVIAKYIAEQNVDQGDDFKADGWADLRWKPLVRKTLCRLPVNWAGSRRQDRPSVVVSSLPVTLHSTEPRCDTVGNHGGAWQSNGS